MVVNDGFWPDMAPEQLRKDIRLDGTATPERLQIALLAAMWTDVTTQWASPITERLYTGAGTNTTFAGSTASSRVLSETFTDLETLRPISVRFDLAGWGPGEALGDVSFDGLAVVPAPLAGGTLVANPQGELAGTIEVPAGVPSGARVVNFTGPLGSHGSQTFMGQGTAVLRTQQQVTTESWALSYPAPVYTGGAVFGPSGAGSTPTQNQSACSKWLYDGYFDPLAQTFVLDELTQCAGVDLPFTAKGGPVVAPATAAWVPDLRASSWAWGMKPSPSPACKRLSSWATARRWIGCAPWPTEVRPIHWSTVRANRSAPG